LTFQATILKKSNKGAVQHRCSFVGRPITRRVGIRSKVCKGRHPGACIVPLDEHKEDEKDLKVAKEEKQETEFCPDVKNLTYVKNYAESRPLSRVRVWRLSESTKYGSKSSEYYDCECNKLFPPVANIEVAKKHACQHDCHLQVNTPKKIQKARSNKMSSRDRLLSETLPQEMDPRGTYRMKRQKTNHIEYIPRTNGTLMPSKPITWSPAMFYNPQIMLNSRLWKD
jgi:hypothetical protein